MFAGNERDPDLALSFFDDIPPSVLKLSFDLIPAEAGWMWYKAGEQDWDPEIWAQYSPEVIGRAVARACGGQAGTIWIVMGEDMAEDFKRRSGAGENFVRYLRQQIFGYGWTSGLTEAEAKSRAKRIKIGSGSRARWVATMMHGWTAREMKERWIGVRWGLEGGITRQDVPCEKEGQCFWTRDRGDFCWDCAEAFDRESQEWVAAGGDALVKGCMLIALVGVVMGGARLVRWGSRLGWRGSSGQ
jgi:hypothetical protein